MRRRSRITRFKVDALRFAQAIFVHHLPSALLVLLLILPELGKAQGLPQPAGNAPEDVIAKLGEQNITRAEVDFLLGRREAGDTPLPAGTLNAATYILAQQRLALETMRRLNLAADEAAIDRRIERNLADRLDLEPGASLRQRVALLAAQWNITPESYRETIAFRVSWEAHLQRHLTQANLARHFGNQPARFNGTEFSIHRVWLAVPIGESDRREAARQILTDLRTNLKSAADWQQALATAQSDHQERLQEANLKLESVTNQTLQGVGDVEAAIVDAVLGLDEGTWSKPVDTINGVHLLHLIHRQPGTDELSEVEGSVRGHLLVFLLEHLAKQSREKLPLRVEPAQKP